MEFQLGMALGEKLFEESGNITGFKVTKVHPVEGVTIESSFASKSGVVADFQAAKIWAQVPLSVIHMA